VTNDAPLDDLIDRAIKGVRELQEKNDDELKEWLKNRPFLPPTIPLGFEGVRLITDDGLQALHEFGRRWRNEDVQRRSRLDENTAAQLAAKVFGDMLQGEVLKGMPPDTDAKRAFKELLDKNLEALSYELEYSFPCRLFDDDHVASFEVGPVRFLRRNEWLSAVALRASPAKAPLIEIVESYWSGKGSAPADSEMTANAVATDFISNWVATVSVSDRARHNARAMAEVAVRVAIDTLGLPMGAKTGGNLRGPGDEIRTRLARVFSQLKGRDIDYSIALDRPRLAGRPGDYAKFIGDTARLREAAGKALTSLIELSPATPTPTLHRRWVEAMHWFGEARRETVPSIALVKIGICLDVLAKGRRAKSILALCSALFGMKETDRATSVGHNLKRLIETIYDEGRSQIAHGGKLFLLGDLPISREDADYVASAALELYVSCLDLYSGPDDYDAFAKAIPALRASLV